MRSFWLGFLVLAIPWFAPKGPESPPAPGGTAGTSPVPVVTRIRPDIPPMTLDSAAGLSDEIVLGLVQNVETVEPEEGFSYRKAVIIVEQALKGVAPDLIEVRVGGGRTKTRTVLVDGAPEFRAGDVAVIFLCADPGRAGVYGVLGLERGVVRVDTTTPDARVGGALAIPGESVEAFLGRARTAVDDAARGLSSK